MEENHFQLNFFQEQSNNVERFANKTIDFKTLPMYIIYFINNTQLWLGPEKFQIFLLV